MHSNQIIRSIRELPDWYNLEKYNDSSSLDASSWYELILQRRTHFFCLDLKRHKKYKDDKFSESENPYYSALLQSRKNPLSLLTNDSQIFLIGGGKLAALKYDEDDFSTFSYAITPLTIRCLYQQERRLKKVTRKRMREWMDKIFDGFYDPDNKQDKEDAEWAKSFIDDPIFEAFEREDERSYTTERHHDLVQIDLSVPDNILVQQFTDYIRYVRQKYPDVRKAQKYKPPEFQKWIDYSVLPYLDLSLWAQEEGCTIPNRVMADAIFSDGEKGEEAVRKTTKKIANRLIEEEYVNFLATIAAHEIAEKKLGKTFRQK